MMNQQHPAQRRKHSRRMIVCNVGMRHTSSSSQQALFQEHYEPRMDSESVPRGCCPSPLRSFVGRKIWRRIIIREDAAYGLKVCVYVCVFSD